MVSSEENEGEATEVRPRLRRILSSASALVLCADFRAKHRGRFETLRGDGFPGRVNFLLDIDFIARLFNCSAGTLEMHSVSWPALRWFRLVLTVVAVLVSTSCASAEETEFER